jgi:hypothetical protein
MIVIFHFKHSGVLLIELGGCITGDNAHSLW